MFNPLPEAQSHPRVSGSFSMRARSHFTQSPPDLCVHTHPAAFLQAVYPSLRAAPVLPVWLCLGKHWRTRLGAASSPSWRGSGCAGGRAWFCVGRQAGSRRDVCAHREGFAGFRGNERAEREGSDL